MKCKSGNEQIKNLGRFSWNLWNGSMESFLSMYILFEAFKFKSVWNTMDSVTGTEMVIWSEKNALSSAALLGLNIPCCWSKCMYQSCHFVWMNGTERRDKCYVLMWGEQWVLFLLTDEPHYCQQYKILKLLPWTCNNDHFCIVVQLHVSVSRI